jgi:rare lipoprotein A
MMRVARLLVVAAGASALAACATQPVARSTKLAGRVWDPKLGVWSSPQVVADGDSVPRGGGSYLTGRPYVIGGRTYVPSQNAAGYVVVGTASWYGDAFHGRRTANGEVFDKRSISAAHPTLPLPSYVRVTNMGNGRSMIVRVNDRGPYHGGRVMDVSQRVAEALAFRGAGMARVKVEYIGSAPLSGSDDDVLMASLRTDGGPARIDGMPNAPVMLADTAADPAPASADPREPSPANRDDTATAGETAPPVARSAPVPVPPPRPFSLGDTGPAQPGPERRRPKHLAEAPPLLALPPPHGKTSPLLRRAGAPIMRHQAWLDGDRD